MYKVFLYKYTTQKMKKLLSIFSLLILTFSNIIQAYTFADSWDNLEQAKEILTNELNNTLNELSNNTDWDFTNNLEQGPEIITQDTIDWYQCFWITAWSTEASVTKYNCEYEDIIVPWNIKYLNWWTFSWKIINTIRFENEDTNIIWTAFSWAIISWNITLPGNQEYNERSVLENIIIWENWTLKINKPASTSKIKVYGEAIVDFSERNSNYINSYWHFNNSYVDWTIVFTWYNGQVWSPWREILHNSILTENWKIIFDENITWIYGLFNQSNSECKGEIVLPNNSNIYYSFYQTNYDWLKINNTFNIINSSFITNQWRSTTISWNIFAKKIENSFWYVTVNWNIIISKDEINNDEQTISSSFYGWTISWDVIISWDNIKFWVWNMTNEIIIWDLTITWQNLNISAWIWFNPVNISWDLKIYSNNLNVDSTFQTSEIWWSIILKGDENLTLSKNVFSSTKIWKDIILSWNNIDIELYAFWVMWPKWVTIWNNLEIYTSEINTDNSFNDMNISWDIKINWWNINLDKSFKKWKINKWIKIITDDFTGTNNTFEKANINWDFEINWKNIKMTNWFFWSWAVSKDITIKWENITWELSAFANLKVAWNFEAIWNNLNFNRSFLVKNQWSTPEIGKNLLMSWKNIVYYDGSLDGWIKTKNLIIKWDNIEIKNSFNLDNNYITWIIVTNDLIIDVKNLTWDNSFKRPKISGNLILSWINMILKNNFMAGDYTENAKIWKDLRITANNLIFTWNNSALYQLNVNWDTIISWDHMELRYWTLGRSKFSWDLKLYSNNFFTDYGLLYNSEITWNLRLPKNTTLWIHASYKTSIKNNLILWWAKTIIPSGFAFSWWIIIEDWNESIDNIFKDYKVWNNEVTINWTLSTIWEKAYAFKAWTRIINTITLAEDFSTWNIWDNAFCIEWWEPVKWITKKQYTEEEYQDLLSRACIDLNYTGTHSLLLRIDWEEAIVEYDWINNVVTPETLKKDWYRIEWFEDEDLLTWTDINKQLFEDFEYQKTIYGKYIEIPIIPSAWWGQSITPAKQETKVTEQEHNSADNEDQKVINTQTNTTTSNTVATEEIKQQVKKVEDKSLTRWEIAIMTNILLEVYPQLVEWKQELDDVTNACSNYADEQNFTKDEKKAITRLCKLSIMWIHNDTNEPLEEFLTNKNATNDEFSKVINRSVAAYNEKDLSTIKDALKKLEWDEENVVFGTVYDVFMSIKSIFN